jgi:hypothetical protein
MKPLVAVDSQEFRSASRRNILFVGQNVERAVGPDACFPNSLSTIYEHAFFSNDSISGL